MKYISNAFSFNMVDPGISQACIIMVRASPAEVVEIIPDCYSIVGHADTAALFATMLGAFIPCNRESVTLKDGDYMVIGQYRGPRLAEGATTLPEGASIDWMVIQVKDMGAKRSN